MAVCGSDSSCVSTSGGAGVGATGAVVVLLMYCTWFYLLSVVSCADALPLLQSCMGLTSWSVRTSGLGSWK